MMTGRHVQLLRALLAAVAAAMITFSPDHSAEVGLAVFSGFAVASAAVLGLATWLVQPQGERGRLVLLAAVYLVAGVVSGLPQLRNTTVLFAVLIAWGLLAGLVELIIGLVERRAGRETARDTIGVGALGLVLALAVAIVPTGYRLDYFIEDAGRSFTLTGTIIAVGLLGGYAALVAVWLGIAGLSPRPTAVSGPRAASAAEAAPSASIPSAPTPKDPQ
ncbi:acyl-CoA synthetase [Microbacterium sp. Marseille-Q6965]|uniref:acyl-CoA synthetase n=1 Tax=Microbacterium sp. Marseille-Q6965 TaxID=2965072 RepID=UPI0021B771DE|nr:acyl-CoA synthetase [Microbacterium sp. Marseille-Q6965]